jgi:stage V sporulation protein B
MEAIREANRIACIRQKPPKVIPMTKEISFYRKLTVNSVYLVVGSIFANMTLFFSYVLLARFFEPDAYGTIMLIISVNATFVLIAEMGIPVALTKFIPEEIQNPQRVGMLISSGLKMMLGISIVFAIILYILSPKLSSIFFENDVGLLLKVTTIWIFCLLFYRLIIGVFNGYQEMKFSLISTFLFDGFRFLFLVIAVLLGSAIDGIITAWSAAMITGLLVITVIFIFFLKKRNVRIKWASNQGLRVIRYSIFLALPFLGIYFIPYLFNLLIGCLSTPENVAFFSISLSLSSIIFLFAIPLSTVLMPAASEAFASGDWSKIKISSRAFLKYLWLFSFIILFALCFFGRHIITFIYGEKYISAFGPLTVVAFAVFIESSKVVTNPLLNGTKHARTVTLIEAIRFGLIFGLGSIFIYLRGINGAAIALLIANTVSTVSKIYRVRKDLNVNLVDIMLQFIPLVIVLSTSVLFNLPWWLFGAVGIAIILYFKMLSLHEIRIILSLFRSCAN